MIGIDEDIFFSWLETTKLRLLSVIIPYIFTYIFVITIQKTWIEVSKIVRKNERDIGPFRQFLDLDSCHNYPGAMVPCWCSVTLGQKDPCKKMLFFSNVHHLKNDFFFVVSQLILSHAQLVEDFLNYLVTSTKLPWRIITVDLGWCESQKYCTRVFAWRFFVTRVR